MRELVRLASHLDVRGQYDLADRLERLAAKYEWPQQYTLPFDEDLSQDDPMAQGEPTPYWQATNALDPQDAPGAVIPKDFYSHPSQEELEAGNFVARPPAGDDYGGDEWWVALPGAYDRLYQLMYTLNEIEDEERRAGGGQYLDDSRNNRLLRLKLRRPEIEAEAETMARQIAARSYQIIREWIDGHISHSHPLMGGTEEEILDDVYSNDEDKIDIFREHILATVKLIFSENVADVERIARLLGVSVDDDRRYRFDMDWEEELGEMVEEATAYDEDVDIGPEMVMDLSYRLRRLIDSPEYSKARRQEVEETHPQFKPMVELANMFEAANNWRDLIIPIDLTKDMLHRNGNLMQDYGGFHPDLDYQRTFDDISSGAREPVWNADIRRSSTQGRFIKLAMPYRWEDNEDRARKITKEGYDPQDALYVYIDEYADQFEADLSDEAKAELEAFKEQIGLDQELQTYGRGGRRWEKYVDKLGDLWFDEHPDERLLWLADHPGNAIEFSGRADGEYRNNLLRYSPPVGHEPKDFLNDYSYGYATKVKLPPGSERIPAEWFSMVSPEEWNAHKNDHGHWASQHGSRFIRLAWADDEDDEDEDWNERPLFKSDKLRDCVGWVDRNWRQLLSTREKSENREVRR